VSGAAPADLSVVFEEHRSFLWGLSYRLTGSAADAEDVVQETFLRVLERPPPRTDQPWRPWVVRVALNLGRDLLRRRRRRGYVGPWLPSPIETGDEATLPGVEARLASGETTEGRYDMLESVSFAFLLALEVLTPRQRAVLLLRDVFDYSVREVADALDISEGNVKTTHHRARRAMRAYEGQRVLPTRERQATVREVTERFVAALLGGDARAVEALLTESAVALTDGGGEFLAARRPVRGADKVARFYVGLTRWRLAATTQIELRHMNGLPAIVLHTGGGQDRLAPLVVTHLDLDRAGRVTAIHSVLASGKLTALRRVQRPVQGISPSGR
jgi:RNA polymerase sigma-70 factor (ECF subfamily)